MRHWPIVGLLIARCLRRWPYSKPTMGQRFMFAGGGGGQRRRRVALVERLLLPSQHCQPVPPPVDKLPTEKTGEAPSSDCLVVYNQFVTPKKSMAATVSRFLSYKKQTHKMRKICLLKINMKLNDYK